MVCQKCGWINYENPLPVAVCAAMNEEREILIAKRNLKPGTNKWALPGGFIELNETPGQACLRELKEETNVEGEIARLIGVYVRKTREYGAILIIGYEVNISKCDILVNSELKDARFFNKKALPVIPFLSHRKIIEAVYKKDERK